MAQLEEAQQALLKSTSVSVLNGLLKRVLWSPSSNRYWMKPFSRIADGDRQRTLRKVWKAIEGGGEWMVDADLKDFFESNEHK